MFPLFPKTILFSIASISCAALNLSCAHTEQVLNKKAPQAQKLSPIPVVYSPDYKISVFGMEKLHPFDIAKYDKIYAALKKDGIVDGTNTHDPKALTDEELLLIHTKQYLVNLKDVSLVARDLEAPVLKIIPKKKLDKMIVTPFKKASGGTLLAARLALKNGTKMAFNLGGGYHHAKPEKGEGFCIIADVPIAIRKLQKEGLIKKALIIDTDIHQGNGTIACLKNDPSTFTFSLHEGGIYPMPKEKGDLDISLHAGITDQAYLQTLEKSLKDLFQKSKPDIVFHVAGCDALAKDPLANGKMTHEGIAKRDALIVSFCKKHNVPYVMTLSGGYSKDAWNAQYKSIKNLIANELNTANPEKH